MVTLGDAEVLHSIDAGEMVVLGDQDFGPELAALLEKLNLPLAI